MKVRVLIFSKDRALQLDATLRSLFTQVKDFEQASITVLYRTSLPTYTIQYQTLIVSYPSVRFINEKDFRNDLIELLMSDINDPQVRLWIKLFSRINSVRLYQRFSISELVIRFLMRLGVRQGILPFEKFFERSYWLIGVDDSLFIKPFSLREIVGILEENPESIGFSLRLGQNINYCYMENVFQELPEFRETNWDKVLYFKWVDSKYDFSYSLEISSSIYRSSLFVPLVACLFFTTPNMLESKMASIRFWFAKRFPYLLCHTTSLAFSNPLNKVQIDRPHNRSSEDLRYSTRELANLFNDGKRFDLSSLDGFVPTSCHQEVEMKFTQVN